MVLSPSSLSGPYGAPSNVKERLMHATSQLAPLQTFCWSDFPLVHQHNPDAVFESSPPTVKQPLLSIDFTSSFSSDVSVASSSSSVSSSRSSHGKRVSFAPSIEVREYALQIGDHPCCEALPLSLGWTYFETHQCNYAASSRRHGSQLRLTYYERKNLLRQAGYSESDIRDAEGLSRTSPLRHVPTAAQFSMYC